MLCLNKVKMPRPVKMNDKQLVWFRKVKDDVQHTKEDFKHRSLSEHYCTESNRSDLLRELLPLASEWQIISVLLDIPDGDLDTIQENNPRNQRNCLQEMIKTWLRMTNPTPTWERLVEAVRPINPQKAQELELKYISKTYPQEHNKL